MSKQEITKYNDALSQVYDKATTRAFKWKAPKESNLLILHYTKKGNSVLDIGIGTGQSSEALQRAGCKVTGIDISAKMLEIAKKKFPKFKLYKADIENNLPALKDKKFDIVVAIGVLEFVNDIEKVLRKVHKLLKPDGLFCFTYEKYLPKSKLQKWKVSELGRGLVGSKISFLVHRYTPNQIQKMLEKEDLEILKTKSFEAYLKSQEKIPVHYQIILAKA